MAAEWRPNGDRAIGVFLSSATRVMGRRGRTAQALRAELEACYSKSPELLASVLDRYGVHEVAGLLKQILRHLPEPLLTNKYADAFVQVGRKWRRSPLHEAWRPCSRSLTLPAPAGVPTLLLQLKALNLLVLVLPGPNRDTLLALVHFLADVAELAPRNRMSLHNVAMVLAPNLFSPKRRKATEENLQVARTTTTLTRMLVWYRQILWTLLSQVRMAYRMELDKKQLKENKARIPPLVRRPGWDGPSHLTRSQSAPRRPSKRRPYSGRRHSKKKRKERPSWFAARDAGDGPAVEAMGLSFAGGTSALPDDLSRGYCGTPFLVSPRSQG
ncbi:hypothetical protein IscW_ISCW000487 [Ixodes scapularis]|uniref:Rho-GAP domain-containing protein n=1 Tax=Ixodes scapularis TaxID=6945 RepID=B7P6Z9_IXOSC|nr:hypothetical protein IscW_ISCW000487 [Ixodes scapularis]|eukprot:XP_002409424.1 hypothetical protein IscW_ISCW000487 [Ixodes scapularis]